METTVGNIENTITSSQQLILFW